MSREAPDQARLARILKLAREIELAWPGGGRDPTQNLARHTAYQELKNAVSACAEANSGSLRRLADRASHLHDEISLAHFYACIVPFERLSSRAPRDDEFLVEEGDRAEKALAPLPLKLVAENLRSAFNVGALFRTSECLGLSEIILSGYTPGPDDEKTSRTAMGTSARIPWRRVDRARTACEELKREDYKIVALETAANAVALNDFKFGGEPTAFVIGNERFGIDGDTLRSVDAICRIPARGVKNSMNVGVAFGIGAFEWLRQYESVEK